jgi:hypothetical protein
LAGNRDKSEQGRKNDALSRPHVNNAKEYLTLEDHSTWYYKKAVAVGALMWYNLTTEANTHWRNRWFPHLLGNESEVLIRRSKFPKEDALVRLFISRKSKSNKKKFVLSYPDD